MEFTVNDPVKNPPVTEIIGPFRGDIYKLVVEGCAVPHVQLLKMGGQSEGDEFDWKLLVDERFAALVKTEDILNQWGHVLAQAMAVAAGYTHHGPGSKLANRFTCSAND